MASDQQGCRCQCGQALIESDAYLARILGKDTHWFCPAGCDDKTPKDSSNA